MRVAMLSPLFESVPPKLYGGTERVVYNLCKGLTEAGVEVTLFASGDSRSEARLQPVVPEALRLAKVPVRDPIAYNLKMLSEVASRAHEFDIIHNHHDYWMLPLSEMTRTPLVTTLHGQLDLPDLDAAFKAFPNSYFISISNAQRAPMPYLNWAKTILHGIDLSKFEYREKPGEYLAFLGRITEQKRPDYAIEIAKKSGVPLKIAAKIEGKEMQDYYDAFVRPHVDGKFIEYIGEISDSEKSDFLGGALATAFTIDWPEPFGLVMIESLACGTPVLARPFGSVNEILADGTTGYIDRSIEVLSSRVKDLGQIDRAACRRWVEERFSLKRMTEEYIHVYRHLYDFSSAGAAPTAGLRTDRRGWDLVYPVQRAADGNTQDHLQR